MIGKYKSAGCIFFVFFAVISLLGIDAFAYKPASHYILIEDVAQDLSKITDSDSDISIICKALQDCPNIAAWGSCGPDFGYSGAFTKFGLSGDQFHYDKVGSLAAIMIKKALDNYKTADTPNAKSKALNEIAFSAGWISHIAGDMAFSGMFTNPYCGSVYFDEKTHEKRSKLTLSAESILWDIKGKNLKNLGDYNFQGLLNKFIPEGNTSDKLNNVYSVLEFLQESCKEVFTNIPGTSAMISHPDFNKENINITTLALDVLGLDYSFKTVDESLNVLKNFDSTYDSSVQDKVKKGELQYNQGYTIVQKLEKAYNEGKANAVKLLIAASKGDYSTFSNKWNLDAIQKEDQSLYTFKMCISNPNKLFSGSNNKIDMRFNLRNGKSITKTLAPKRISNIQNFYVFLGTQPEIKSDNFDIEVKDITGIDIIADCKQALNSKGCHITAWADGSLVLDKDINKIFNVKDNIWSTKIGPSVLLNGNQLDFDTLPVIENGTTLVPMRAIFESLNASVSWDAVNKTITATKGDITVKLKIGDKTAFKNNNPIQLLVEPKIVNSRTLVPLRFVSESLGAIINWEAETQVISIDSSVN